MTSSSNLLVNGALQAHQIALPARKTQYGELTSPIKVYQPNLVLRIQQNIKDIQIGMIDAGIVHLLDRPCHGLYPLSSKTLSQRPCPPIGRASCRARG